MSRIGKMPIAIPAGVTVDIAENNKVTVKGPKGTLERVLPAEMTIKKEGEEVVVTRPNDLKKMKSLHGLTRTLIYNMVIGVTEGYQKELEVNGVGYRAQKQGKKLILSLGYSHPVEKPHNRRESLFPRHARNGWNVLPADNAVCRRGASGSQNRNPACIHPQPNGSYGNLATGNLHNNRELYIFVPYRASAQSKSSFRWVRVLPEGFARILPYFFRTIRLYG